MGQLDLFADNNDHRSAYKGMMQHTWNFLNDRWGCAPVFF